MDIFHYPESEICYRRKGDTDIRFTLKGLTNHETRNVLVGIWARLDEADRTDFILELVHHHTEPGSRLSGLSQIIRDCDKPGFKVKGVRAVVDVAQIKREEHDE
jgi:hypothetical protein